MADYTNIYSLLVEDEPVQVTAPKTQQSSKPQSRPTTTTTTQSGPKKDVVRNRKPAPTKDGQFEEKPDHKGEKRDARHHKYQKPAHGRAFDRKSGTHPVKGGDKKEVAGASWGNEVDAQLATATEEVQEGNAYFFLMVVKLKKPQKHQNQKKVLNLLPIICKKRPV
jgi:hypothetical protein